MRELNDTLLGQLTLDEEGYGTTQLMVDGRALDVAVNLEGPPGPTSTAGSDLVGRPIEDLLTLAMDAVNGPGRDETDMYLEHHLEEFAAEETEALLGTPGPATADQLRAALQPITLHVSGPADDFVVDVSFAPGMTDYLLAVRIDRAGIVSDVAMES